MTESLLTIEATDEKYMRRCLQLAVGGRHGAKPNPMVGAVIVARGRVIGEGYHVRWGEGHAEVNAFASVRRQDEALLHDATLYVSLEPCSHYGKTPPCADLIIAKGVRRVVVGCVDPFAKVHGRGIKKLEAAGIEVRVGVLEAECRHLNKRFITFHELHRPYIIMKWAQSANGFIDDNCRPKMFSTPFTQTLSHKLRADNDAIVVGRATDEREHPRLNVRRWWGRDPMRIVIDRRSEPFATMDQDKPLLPQLMEWLYARDVQSLIVEGGAATHASFIEAGLWDELRVETSPVVVSGGTRACPIPADAVLEACHAVDGNTIATYGKRDGRR